MITNKSVNDETVALAALTRIAAQAGALKDALLALPWESAIVASSPALGTHFQTLWSHLDNAQGRASTFRDAIKTEVRRLRDLEIVARPR